MMEVPVVPLWSWQVGLVHLHWIGPLVHRDGAAADQRVVVVVNWIIIIIDAVEGDRLAHDRVVARQVLQQMVL